MQILREELITVRSSIGIDQAEGLRRMLVHNKTKVVTVAAEKPGRGRASVTINLAAALAHIGKGVLVLDENHAPNNLPCLMGLFSRYDLLDVVQGRCTLDDAVMSTNGFDLLPTARATQALPKLNHAEQQRLERALTELSSGIDMTLVNAATHIPGKAGWQTGQHSVLSCMSIEARLLVVTDATASGITESYAFIKRLALENAHVKFEIVVNKAADEQAAITVFENMSRVAYRHLAARLEYSGYIPIDTKLKRAALLGRPVVEAFPAAMSARAYQELAQRLLCLPVTQSGSTGSISCIMRTDARRGNGTCGKLSHVFG